MLLSVSIGVSEAVSLLLPLIALLAGYAVYRDAMSTGRDRYVAALVGFIIAGLLLAGSVPGLVALALAQEQATQGFPTSLRLVPGITAVLVYLYFR